MPQARHRCKQCRRTDEEVGSISRAGLCQSCGLANLKAHQAAMAAKEGPAYEEWQRRWAAGCGQLGRPITPY